MRPSRSASRRLGDASAILGVPVTMAVAYLRESVHQANAERQPDGWGWPLALSALALVYANGLAWLAGPRHAEPSAFVATGNLISVPALLAVVALFYRQRWSALGIERRNLRRAVALGAAAGAAMALPALVVFALPPLMAEPLRWEVASALSGREFALRIFVHLAIGAALFEELLFRGLLWDLFVRAGGVAAAWLGTSVVFALWHVVLAMQSVGQTNVPAGLAPLAVTLALLGVLAGGLAFGALRLLSGVIAAAIAHWVVDVLMLSALVLR